MAIGLLLGACQSPGSPTAASPGTTSPAGGGPDLVWLQGDPTPRLHTLIDWSGQRQGSLLVEGQIFPSPDGRRVMVGASMVLDSKGSSLGGVGLPGYDIRDSMWADDSRHLCLLALPLNSSPDYVANSLWLVEPGKPARRVATVGEPGALPGLTACSIANDRAVIISDYSAHIPPPQGNRVLITAEVQVIGLSTGSAVYQHDYLSDTTPVAILATSSADGRFLVENGVLKRDAVIRDLSTGKLLETLPGIDVAGFSWDGARLVERSPSGTDEAVTVVDRLTQQVIWHQAAGGIDYLPRRQSSDLLFSVYGSSMVSTLILVPASGPAVRLPAQGFLVAACPCLGAGAGA